MQRDSEDYNCIRAVVDTILCHDLARNHHLQSNVDNPSAYGDVLVSVLIFILMIPDQMNLVQTQYSLEAKTLRLMLQQEYTSYQCRLIYLTLCGLKTNCNEIMKPSTSSKVTMARPASTWMLSTSPPPELRLD